MSNFLQIALFGFLSLVLLQIARAQGFFFLPPQKSAEVPPIRWYAVLVVFAIYLGMNVVVAPWILSFVPPSWAGAVQLFALGGCLLLFVLYARASAPSTFQRVCKDSESSIGVDFGLGVLTWVVAFPCVLFVGQCLDTLLYYLGQVETVEQVAVRYLKNTLASPERLTIALVTILLFAPVIEEFLFRGCLQTWLKRHLTRGKSIALSSGCFALFHYASSQGASNISLLLSLFTFALFLGFIYERQRSLFASIGLHMTFNAVSTLRILYE